MDLMIDTATNALALDNGDLVLTEQGIEAVAQRLSLRLGLFRSEWFLNTGAGTPWREQILVRPADLSAIRALLLARVATCKGVAEVTAFDLELDRSSRRLTFTFRVRADESVPGLEGEAEGAGLVNLDDPNLLCLVDMSGGIF